MKIFSIHKTNKCKVNKKPRHLKKSVKNFIECFGFCLLFIACGCTLNDYYEINAQVIDYVENSNNQIVIAKDEMGKNWNIENQNYKIGCNLILKVDNNQSDIRSDDKITEIIVTD